MNIVLPLVMLAAFALLIGAFVYWRKTGEVKQPALMVVLAIVAILNVLIWTLPTADGQSPVEKVEAGSE